MKKSRWCFQVPRGYWRKSWKITKMFSVLMCALTFSVSAAAFAQHERVTLNFRQATVRQVLNEIQRQTRLSFIYNTEQTEQLGQISVEAHNESVTSLLDRILTGTGLTWKIQEDLILISQAGPETTAIPGNRSAYRNSYRYSKNATTGSNGEDLRNKFRNFHRC